MSAALKALVAVLDADAPSFCYYEAAKSGDGRMPLPLFSKVVEHARERRLPLQLVCGSEGLPDAYRAVATSAGCNVTCYLPAEAAAFASDVPIVEAEAADAIHRLVAGRHPVAILRAGAEHFDRLPEIWRALANRVYRVVLVLRQLAGFDDAALDAYSGALDRISAMVASDLCSGREFELNVLTDRLWLSEFRSCMAGIDHLTVDWRGRWQLCPGFTDQDSIQLGSFGEEPSLVCRPWLEPSRAPICSACDAYQCRRCVYLNQHATLELNTPPWQTCRAAHIEREASRLLLARLREAGRFPELGPIAKVNYSEPLQRLLAPRFEDRPRPRPRDIKEDPMNKAVVGRVDEAERDRIRELYLRRNGLTELFASLAKLDQQTLATTPLYERIVKDMGATALAFQDWWDKTAQKYGWEKREGKNWRIDFETCQVFQDD